MKLTTPVLSALLGIAGLAASASAQTTLTAPSTDLYLGFYATAGTGSSSNLEVDLGAISSFTTGAWADGQAHSIGHLSALDLSATYGSSWNTSTSLFWGLAGATGTSSNPNIFISHVATPGTASGGYDIVNSSLASQASRRTARAGISSISTNLAGLTSTVNSNFATVVATSSGGSWSSLGVDTANQVDFTQYNLPEFDNGTNIAHGSYAVSDLYELTNAGAEAYIGSFALDSSGQLWFSSSASSFAATAVPEPATYAAIVGALALGAVVIRRRRQAAAA